MKRVIFPIMVFSLFVACWEGLSFFQSIPSYILPSPHVILLEFFNNISIIFSNLKITVLEALSGFIVGSILGIFLGISIANSRLLELGMYPYAIALNTIPIVAFVPLIIMWVGFGLISNMVISALISFFPAIVNTVRGQKAVSTHALDLMKSFSASKWQIFRKLRLPTSVPYIFSALKITCTLSVVGAIVGEMFGGHKGIGYMILITSYRLETELLFASIFASSMTGITFFVIVSLIERVFFKQKYYESEVTV